MLPFPMGRGISREALAAVKAAAQAKRASVGLPAVAPEDVEHEALLAQRPASAAASARARAKEAKLRKAGLSIDPTEAEKAADIEAWMKARNLDADEA